MNIWKKGLLTALLLTAAVFLPLQARAAGAVPQVTFLEQPMDAEDGAYLKMQVEFRGRELTEEDFQNPNDRDKPVAAGEVIVTLLEGQDSNRYNPKQNTINWEKEVAEFVEASEVAAVEYCYDEGYVAHGDSWIELPVTAPWTLQLTTKEGEKFYLDYEIKMEFPAEYIVENVSDEKFIEVEGLDKGDYTVTQEGDTYTLHNRWASTVDALAKEFTFTPRYAYGATGVGSSDGSFTTGNMPGEEDITFSVKNIKGDVKTFHLKIDMPWNLDIKSVKEKVQKVVADGVEQGADITGEKFRKLQAGAQVHVYVTAPEGQRLSAVKLENTAGGQVPVTVGADSFSFVMPKSALTLQELTFQKADAVRYAVNTQVEAMDRPGEVPGGWVSVQMNGTEITQAAAGDTLTVKASPTDQKSLYAWQFDHWETEGIVLSAEDQKKDTLTLTMPTQKIRLKAVFARGGAELTIGVNQKIASTVTLRVDGVRDEISTNSSVTDRYKTKQTYQIRLQNANYTAYRFLGWQGADGSFLEQKDTADIKWVETGEFKSPNVTLQDGSSQTFTAVFEAKMAGTLQLGADDAKKGTVSATVDGNPVTAATVLYEEQQVSLKAEPKTGYVFEKWQVTKPEADHGVVFADAAAAETTFTVPEQIQGGITIQAVFAEDASYKSDACDMTKVELLKQDGTLVKTANKSGKKFTISLSPKEMTPEEAGKLTAGGYVLRTATSEKSTVAMTGGHDDAQDPSASWNQGITNSIGKNQSAEFVVTAEDGAHKNTYTVAITYDDRPVLTAGRVQRLSDTEAKVDFISSSAGEYYWAVVDAGAAEPSISTDGVGKVFKNAGKAVTIDIDNLTAGAKEIYIVVKDNEKASDVKISDKLKIAIPAYDSDEVRYKIETTADPESGKVSVDKTEAKEGEVVTVTVTPNSGKQMKAGSLRYSQGGPPYDVVPIDEKTMQFTMPNFDISVSCTFVNAAVEDTQPSITAFIINGVQGVINQTTGNITITMPHGTALDNLTPQITLKNAASVSPASGTAVNLSSPVTYTVTGEDGSTRTYRVSAYVGAPSVSDKLWEDMLDEIGGSTDSSGKNTWWEKAREIKKHNDFPSYW